MAILDTDMQRVVREQRLGYVATVCPDGTPNVSPKGTLTVWDADHLVFADIASPGTMRNLRANPSVEVNVVDPLVRKGYRFKGRAEVLTAGERFAAVEAFYREAGVASPIRAVALIRVEQARALLSPVYDLGQTEDEVRERWARYWDALWRKRTPAARKE